MLCAPCVCRGDGCVVDPVAAPEFIRISANQAVNARLHNAVSVHGIQDG